MRDVLRSSILAALLLALAVTPALAAAADATSTIAYGKPGATQYAPDPAFACKSGGVNGALGREYKDRAPAGQQPPANDGRLCAAAEALLGWEGTGNPPESVLRELSWYFGLPTTLTQVYVGTFQTEESGPIAETVAGWSKAAAFAGPQVRYGVSTKRLRRDQTRVALVIQDALVELEPVPRALPAGGTAALVGKLAPGLANADVAVGDPAGHLEHVKQAGSDLRAELKCGPKPGRLLVDVRAERAGTAGQPLVAKLAIACGVPLETSFKATVPPPATVLDPAAAEKRLFEQANAERAAAGLPPVAWDEAVVGVARQEAEAARAQGPAFDVQAALQKAQVGTVNVVLHRNESRSAEEAAAANATSAVNRANLLRSDVTHMGVGAVAAQGPQVGTYLIATTILVRELTPFDPEQARARLKAAIAERRQAAGAAPVASDPLLEQVAQQYSELLARTGGKPSKEEDSAVIAPLYKAFREVNLMPGIPADPLEVVQASGIAGKGTLLGVGVASGVSQQLGRNTPFVTVILATKQAAAAPAPAAGAKKKKGH